MPSSTDSTEWGRPARMRGRRWRHRPDSRLFGDEDTAGKEGPGLLAAMRAARAQCIVPGAGHFFRDMRIVGAVTECPVAL